MSRRGSPPTDAEAVELLRSAVATESYSGDEGAVASLLTAWASGRAADAFVDDAGNAVSVWGTGRTEVTFLGHIDTAPGWVDVRFTDGALYGRGAVDAKGSTCTALVAAARLPEEVLDLVTLRVIGAVGEEAPSSKGARFAAATYPTPRALIVGEPSGWDRYTLGYKGRLAVRLRVELPQTHTALEDPTAPETVLLHYAQLREWVERDNGGSEGLFDRLQLALLKIQSGGDGLTEWCEADVAFRLPPRWRSEDLRGVLPGLLPAASLTYGEAVEAVRASNRTGLARAFRVAIRAAQHGASTGASSDASSDARSGGSRGGRATPVVKTGTSDMNVVAPTWSGPGVETVAYGPGDSSLDHTPDEHLMLAEYLRAVDVLGAAIAEYARAQAQVREPDIQ